jgi:uroporphyrin-III C-methyltransferase/precorrin-2 dehydrogenase/sirohydrochlorin ferrochelatase
MTRYPLFLDLRDRPVLVVGAGAVATRRVPRLLDAGADLVVVAPVARREVRELHEQGRLRWLRRPFADTDLDGVALALACTGVPAVDDVVARGAAARAIWCARADDAAASPAWVPAAGTVDGVTVAVSASGDPRRSRDVRDAAVAALRSGSLHARRGRSRAGVVLVGGGPGDPDLITLRGYRELLDADVVVTDRLGPTALLGELPGDVEVIDVGKAPRGRATSQEDINALLIDRARAGQRVVRLKGGDPFVFGRGAEEVLACAEAGVPVDVVPGVTSVTAAPALAGIPLTHRGVTQHFTVASGHVPPGDARSTVDWRAMAAGGGTVVLLMAVDNRAEIAAALIEGGLPRATPTAVVVDASTPHQNVTVASLDALGDLKVRSPAVIVIGEVVAVTNQAVPR